LLLVDVAVASAGAANAICAANSGGAAVAAAGGAADGAADAAGLLLPLAGLLELQLLLA
jgi:hypothetical protein